MPLWWWWWWAQFKKKNVQWYAWEAYKLQRIYRYIHASFSTFEIQLSFPFFFYPLNDMFNSNVTGVFANNAHNIYLIEVVHFRLDIIKRMSIVIRTWGFILCLQFAIC